MKSGTMKKATTIASAGAINANPATRPRRSAADACELTADATLAYFSTTRSYPSTMSVKYSDSGNGRP